MNHAGAAVCQGWELPVFTCKGLPAGGSSAYHPLPAPCECSRCAGRCGQQRGGWLQAERGPCAQTMPSGSQLCSPSRFLVPHTGTQPQHVLAPVLSHPAPHPGVAQHPGLAPGCLSLHGPDQQLQPQRRDSLLRSLDARMLAKGLGHWEALPECGSPPSCPAAYSFG